MNAGTMASCISILSRWTSQMFGVPNGGAEMDAGMMSSCIRTLIRLELTDITNIFFKHLYDNLSF